MPSTTSRYDVIVVGAGNAALTAALSAAQAGARVLVLEKAPEAERGGNSRFSGGLFRFAYETFTGQPELWIWAFSWHLAEQQLEELVGPWFEEVRARLAKD